ncbi:MAG TPA: cell division protein ZapA [Methylomirabilota bacterium]|nr:cell division protein ZapA [Methylomirabilota bacterium]
MPQVTVTIAGKTYRMACDDGQEEHLFGLARRLDAAIDELRGVFGEIGDQRLTVMSAITVLDQLSETESRLRGLEMGLEELRAERDLLQVRQGEMETKMAERVVDIADRIETVAQQLAKPVV